MEKLIEEFETCQCAVYIYDTGYVMDTFRIYCVKSLHHKTGKVLVRFGTKAQVDGIIKTYKKEKRFSL